MYFECALNGGLSHLLHQVGCSRGGTQFSPVNDKTSSCPPELELTESNQSWGLSSEDPGWSGTQGPTSPENVTSALRFAEKNLPTGFVVIHDKPIWDPGNLEENIQTDWNNLVKNNPHKNCAFRCWIVQRLFTKLLQKRTKQLRYNASRWWSWLLK